VGQKEDPYRRTRRRRWTVVLIALLMPVLLLFHVALFNRWYLTPSLATEPFSAAGLVCDERGLYDERRMRRAPPV
jgi:4-amino-4-deoxy-L-arabinose transferase-like glycosyltransferase